MKRKTNYETIKAMNEEQLARFLCAVGADVWGYCKAPADKFDLSITRTWLSLENGTNGIDIGGTNGTH